MKSLENIISEEKEKKPINLKVSKKQETEIIDATLDVSEIDYGEIKGGVFYVKPEEARSLINRWKSDYDQEYGLESVSKSMKKSMLKLVDQLEKYTKG